MLDMRRIYTTFESDNNTFSSNVADALTVLRGEAISRDPVSGLSCCTPGYISAGRYCEECLKRKGVTGRNKGWGGGCEPGRLWFTLIDVCCVSVGASFGWWGV